MLAPAWTRQPPETLAWPSRRSPSIAQVSELFFQLKQAFDEFIVKALGVFMREEWARLAGIVISVNVLSGFVSALYAALIAGGVRRAEDTLL